MKAARILVSGLVQGVGFRPFIERIARAHGLRGYVKNIGGSEVEIWVEGWEDEVYEFILDIFEKKPQVAILDEIYLQFEEPAGFAEFRILKSESARTLRSNIPPDFAMCEHCLREILDPNDRRYLYPFNSCAWCGPRFSMIYKIPYDRENTSMSKYVLCEDCAREYNDINNERRHHAQGISCPRDGPRLALYDNNFELVDDKDPISAAAKLIDEGRIVAVKGIGGYHIAALATDDGVVSELRKRKKRPRKPFAIMGLNVDILKKLVVITEEDEKILKSPQAPILLLPKREDTPVSPLVSPGLYHEGVFVAYSPLHYLLLMNTRDKFLIMTSGNVSGEPMCKDEECASEKLRHIVDYFLVHDREIVNRVDDSVMRRTGDRYVLLRRSRGYAPYWIRINKELSRPVIAFGGDLNNVAAIGFEDKIVLTQYIGDLDSLSAQEDLLRSLEFLISNYGIDPGSSIVVVDKHPSYVSRSLGIEFARKHSAELLEVQHHYTHILGAAADNNIDEKVVGLAIDGLGFGDDGAVWGGEVMVIKEIGEYSRVGSLNPLPLTSDRDTYLPVRLLASYFAKRGYSFNEIAALIFRNGDPDQRIALEASSAYKLYSRGKFVWASSTGRLLDMVMALLDPFISRTYEGEPAITLEAIGLRGKRRLIERCGKVVWRDGLARYDYDELVDFVVENRDKIPREDLSASFQFTLGYMLGELIIKSAGPISWDRVPISGGAAVNEIIYEGLSMRLGEEGLRPVLPRNVPPNDGGIAFGQVIAALIRQI